MFEEKERIISRDNDGLYTIRSRSWIWLNEFERKFKRPINLGPGFLALGIIFLIWGFATLDALENIQWISGALRQCYFENADSIVLMVDDEQYMICADENPQLIDWKDKISQNIPIGDLVEVAVLETVDGSKYIVRLMHNGVEYLNNAVIQKRYKTESDYMRIIGAGFVILGLSVQIRKIVGKRGESR